VKKHDPALKALRGFLRDGPSGRMARFALLAYAFYRGVPYLVAEPQPFRMHRTGRVVPSDRRVFPGWGIDSRQRSMLIDGILTAAWVCNGPEINAVLVSLWLSADPTERVMHLELVLHARLRERHFTKRQRARTVRKLAWTALMLERARNPQLAWAALPPERPGKPHQVEGETP